MDSLTFISETLKAIAWPLSTIGVVVLLRKPIIELAPLMKKLKFKELELEFSRDLLTLKAEAGHSAMEDRIQEEDIESDSRIQNVLSLSTRSAIMEAWLELETSAVDAAVSLWGESPVNAIRDMPRIGRYLVDSGILDQQQLKIFNKLRELRNTSAHVAELYLSESDAKDYIKMARNLSAHIRAKLKSTETTSGGAKSREAI